MTSDPSANLDIEKRLATLVHAYQNLTADSIAELVGLYDAAARFKDPFNDVTGPEAIARIFAHMFRNLGNPAFHVDDRMGSGDQGFLTWRLQFFLLSRPTRMMTITGATHLRFSPDGKVLMHRDYWDAAEELYEKLPVLGQLMRWLRRHASGTEA